MRSSIDLSYDENVAEALRLRGMLEAIDGCPAPVVARVQGHALGGGCGPGRRARRRRRAVAARYVRKGLETAVSGNTHLALSA
jgi:enoyl-CoA hydratase/carnithine racemase